MTITIRIPSFATTLGRGWKVGLLSLLVLALFFTWQHDVKRRAEAGPGTLAPGIFITKLDATTGQPIGNACFLILDQATSAVLFHACDNDFHGVPDISPVCQEPASQCSDQDPTLGHIFVPVQAGTYSVAESISPPGYSRDPGKQVCTVVAGSAGCSGSKLAFQDVLKQSQINISKLGRYVPPRSCYQVLDGATQSPLFSVCDNDWQGAPATSAICIDTAHPGGGGLCSDVDPAVGSIRVTVRPGDYHIVESMPPPEHTADASKHDCNAATGTKCDVTVVDAPIVRPWFPWDTTGGPNGGPDGKVTVADILAVARHYGEGEPLPTP